MAWLVLVASSEWKRHNTNQCDISNHRTTFRASKELTNQATPKTVLPQAMLAQLELVENNRIVQRSSGREDELNRERETRPTNMPNIRKYEK